MNLTFLRLFPRVLTLVLSLCCTCIAQPSATRQELALEVDTGIDQPIEMPALKGRGGGTVRFRRIKPWQPSRGEAPVNDIHFKLDREGEIVIAEITARLENEKNVKIGTYRLGLDETITVEDLAKCGVEPFVLRVVKAKPLINNTVPQLMPIIDNKTKAVEVVSFNKADPPLESFVLILRNVSGKNIIAVDLYIPSPDENGGQGQQARGYGTNPVMRPDGVSSYHINVSGGGRITPTGFVPEPVYQRTLLIRAVVFDDGTYDGLVETAAQIIAEDRGTKIQRRRIFRLLEEQTKPAVPLISIDALKETIYALSITPEESMVTELLTQFPSLNKRSNQSLLGKIGWGLKLGKQEFIHRINDFEERQKQSGSQTTFAEWVKEIRVSYQELISQ